MSVHTDPAELAAGITDALLRDLDTGPEGELGTVVLPHDRGRLVAAVRGLLDTGVIRPGSPAAQLAEPLTGREAARLAAQALADARTAAESATCEDPEGHARAFVYVAQGYRELAAAIAAYPALLLPETKDTDQR